MHLCRLPLSEDAPLKDFSLPLFRKSPDSELSSAGLLIVRLYLLGVHRVVNTFDAAVRSIFTAKVISMICGSTSLAFGLPFNQPMTRERQFDLSELEKLKGISIAMTDDEQPWFMSVSYQRRTDGDKIFAWMFWTAVTVLYGALALTIWWVVK